jgi:hypothetical protein
MPRGPTAGTSSGLRATSAHRGCPSRTSATRGPRSRGDVPSIGIAAGTRIAQASAPPPATAPGACAAALQNCRGNGPQHLAASLSHDTARHFIQLCVGSYIWHRKNSRSGRPRPAHATEPPAPTHLHGHFAKLPRATAAPTGARRPAFRWLARFCSKAACANRMEARAGILGLRSRLVRSGPGGPPQPLQVSRLHRHASCLTRSNSPIQPDTLPRQIVSLLALFVLARTIRTGHM